MLIMLAAVVGILQVRLDLLLLVRLGLLGRIILPCTCTCHLRRRVHRLHICKGEEEEEM